MQQENTVENDVVLKKEPLTYLLTGGAGFIGSHLADALIQQEHTVLVVDNLSTGSLDNISHLFDHPRFHFARANILGDEVVLDRLTSQADVVVHLAAAVGVKLIVDQPVRTIETNVVGTEAVLKVALRYGCRVLVASTSEVYGKGSSFPFREDDDILLGPTSKNRWAYAASKMVDEFLALAYAREYGLQVVPVRFFNTVGPRQTGHYGMVIPRMMQQALEGAPITVYGNGQQSRCFCHVQDVITALIGLSVHPDAPGRVYNVGGIEEITIADLASRIQSIAKSSSEIVHVAYSEAYGPGFEDMFRRIPDISRIRALLGWEPSRSLNEIIRSVMHYESQRHQPAFCGDSLELQPTVQPTRYTGNLLDRPS